MTDERLRITGLAKSFTLHNQGGARIPVFDCIDLAVSAGECLVLNGPSGVGKSTLLRAIYGNYLPERGHILVRHGTGVVDMAALVHSADEGVFAALAHPSYFSRVGLALGVPSWPGELDLTPDAIHEGILAGPDRVHRLGV